MSKKLCHAFAGVLLAAVLLGGCDWFGDDGDSGPVDLTQPWRVADPSDVGVDPAGLDAAVGHARAIPRMLSLVVVRRGRLILEEYLHGNEQETLNDVRSVTKSVVSTLTAIALGHGFVGSLDETLGDHIHPHITPLDSVRQHISIRHLLTMTSGFEWREIGSNAYELWIRSGNHVEYVLTRPIENEPGTDFTYNSGAVHVLGVLLEEAVGIPLERFAEQFLFNRIGIEDVEWEVLSEGYVNGGAGLDLRPRDMARLGQLYLQNGWSGNDRILPEGWIQEATRPKFEWRSTFGPLAELGYGYLWWTEEGQQEYMYLAWGYGGQFVVVVPDKELVVVTTTRWQSVSQDPGGANALEARVLEIITEDVVPAAR
ncbi:MAG: serine hydrolase [Rhodothermales bacterium]|nr:serine hydrolase [Rhodothermales bacterium]